MPKVVPFPQYACYPDRGAETPASSLICPRITKYRALPARLRAVRSTSSANVPSIPNRLTTGVWPLPDHERSPAGWCPESEALPETLFRRYKRQPVQGPAFRNMRLVVSGDAVRPPAALPEVSRR